MGFSNLQRKINQILIFYSVQYALVSFITYICFFNYTFSDTSTDMAWEEALSTLHYMEKQLTIEVQSNIETLRSRMTSSKIDLVSRKAKRLYQMRVLLNTTRRLCREYEDVMADFCGVKATIETAPRGQIGKKIKVGLVVDPVT